MSHDYSKDERKINKYALIVVVVMILLWATTWILTDYYICNPTERGTFGDMFGSVNALFSGIALAGVIYTILLQRIELRQNTAELRGQKEQLKIQNETMQLQKFENSFFQLLSFHQKLHDELKVLAEYNASGFEHLESQQYVHGIIAFEELYSKLNFHIRHRNKSILELYNWCDEELKELKNYIGNYRHLVMFIHDSNTENKQKYYNLFKTQLSSYAKLFLFYFYISDIKWKIFKPIIEQYALFEGMDYDLLLDKSHIRQYDKKAYGDDELPINTKIK